MSRVAASRAAGYKHASDLNNIERRPGREAVRFADPPRACVTRTGTHAIRPEEHRLARLWSTAT